MKISDLMTMCDIDKMPLKKPLNLESFKYGDTSYFKSSLDGEKEYTFVKIVDLSETHAKIRFIHHYNGSWEDYEPGDETEVMISELYELC